MRKMSSPGKRPNTIRHVAARSGFITTQPALSFILRSPAAPIVTVVKRVLTASILSALVAAFSACSALPRKPSLDQMLASAKSAPDHELIAKEYEKEASDAQAEYERHQAGVNLYQKGTGRLHCASLAQDYQRTEQDAAALAAYHRKVAEMKSGTAEPPASAPSASPP